MAVSSGFGTSITPGWFGPPRGLGGPPPNPVSGIVDALFTNGSVLVPDPSEPGAVYQIAHNEMVCPNINVSWRPADRTVWSEACVDCHGFPCEGCDTGGDYRALARAVVAAILAGRGVQRLCSNTVITSGNRSLHQREADGYGQGSEGEEARDGRPEEPEATRDEDAASVSRVDVGGITLVYTGRRSVLARERLEVSTVEGGDVLTIYGLTGIALKTMPLSQALWILRNVSLDDDRRVVSVTWGGE